MGWHAGMVVWETHSATALGVPFMFLAQATAGFTSFDRPAMVTIWLPAARGEIVAVLAVARFASLAVPEAWVIWLPAARGEREASLAVALMVIAAKAAALRVIRRLRVFILILLSVWVVLHCSTRLLYLSYPGHPEIPQKSASLDKCRKLFQLCACLHFTAN